MTSTKVRAKLKEKPTAPKLNVKFDNTEKQQIDVYPGRGPRNRDHLAKPGQSLNPAGRPKGSRNKLSESFVSDMLLDWEQHGPAAICAVRKSDPSTYLRVIAGLVPKEFNIGSKGRGNLESIIEQFSDEQLAELDLALRAISAPTISASAADALKAQPGK